MIAGYGMGNGFELYLQDKAGGNIAAFKKEADKFVEGIGRSVLKSEKSIPHLLRTTRNTGWILTRRNANSRVFPRPMCSLRFRDIARDNMFRISTDSPNSTM